MMSWESFRYALDELRVLLESLRGRGGLRNGLSYVRVSDIVEQSRCERRLEAIMAAERVVDERVREVALLAEVVLGARRRLPEKPPQRVILSLPIVGEVVGIPIVGRPRGILVEEGIVKAVVYASISSRPSRLYEQDRVRGYAFCAALHGSPLPVAGDAVYVHVKGVNKHDLAEAVEEVRVSLEENGQPPMHPHVHVLACDRDASLRALEPLLAYWLGLRDVIVRRGPWCRDCPLRDDCLEAQQPG